MTESKSTSFWSAMVGSPQAGQRGEREEEEGGEGGDQVRSGSERRGNRRV